MYIQLLLDMMTTDDDFELDEIEARAHKLGVRETLFFDMMVVEHPLESCEQGICPSETLLAEWRLEGTDDDNINKAMRYHLGVCCSCREKIAVLELALHVLPQDAVN